MRRSVVFLGSALDRLGVLRAARAARKRGVGPGAGLTVLLYHRVVDLAALGELDDDLVDATPADFDAQMGYLARTFTPVSVEQVLDAHRGVAKLPPDAVLVTFDDGYRDNHEHALPILARHGIKALFFVTTGHITDRLLFWWERVSLLIRRSAATRIRLEYPRPEEIDLSSPAAKRLATRRLNKIIKEHYGLDLDRFLDGVAAACGVRWNDDEGRALADRALMTWNEVKALRAAGMGIGSHTASHRVLLTLRPADLDAELRESRATIERHLGEPSTTIAYPVGRSVARVLPVRQAVADAGYELGFTTTPGTNRLAAPEDPFDLRRLPVDRGVPEGVAHTYLTFPALAR